MFSSSLGDPNMTPTCSGSQPTELKEFRGDKRAGQSDLRMFLQEMGSEPGLQEGAEKRKGI